MVYIWERKFSLPPPHVLLLIASRSSQDEYIQFTTDWMNKHINKVCESLNELCEEKWRNFLSCDQRSLTKHVMAIKTRLVNTSTSEDITWWRLTQFIHICRLWVSQQNIWFTQTPPGWPRCDNWMSTFAYSWHFLTRTLHTCSTSRFYFSCCDLNDEKISEI